MPLWAATVAMEYWFYWWWRWATQKTYFFKCKNLHFFASDAYRDSRIQATASIRSQFCLFINRLNEKGPHDQSTCQIFSMRAFILYAAHVIVVAPVLFLPTSAHSILVDFVMESSVDVCVNHEKNSNQSLKIRSWICLNRIRSVCWPSKIRHHRLLFTDYLPYNFSQVPNTHPFRLTSSRHFLCWFGFECWRLMNFVRRSNASSDRCW